MVAFPGAVKRNLFYEIAQVDVGPILLCQSSEPVLALAMRAEGAIDPDDHTWKITESPDHLAQREAM
jgi:hypothetical protein